jgi:FMN phosphatase YigB (HAD superfamily)
MVSPSTGLVVFILDCDNTLLDNDALKTDLDTRLRALLDVPLVERFWSVYEAVRAQTDTVDYPLTLERFRTELQDADQLARVRALIMDYPFADRLYPDAFATIRYLRAIGLPTIVSDGDALYQPLKIARSGLAAAVEGRVLVYVHKEEHLTELFVRWPAAFYVMVDDKARILSATKARFPDRFVTVHVRQGHYGLDPVPLDQAPDLSIAAIGDLRGYSGDELRRYLAS